MTSFFSQAPGGDEMTSQEFRTTQKLRTILISILLFTTSCSKEDDNKAADADQAPAGTISRENGNQFPNPAGGTDGEASSSCIDGNTFACDVEAAILKYTNEYRASLGLTTMLTLDSHLSYAAWNWSRQEAAAGGISHSGFPSERLEALKARFPDAVVKAKTMSENLLAMTKTSNDADALGKKMVATWITSPGHRANLAGGFNLLGAGIYEVGGFILATQIFMMGTIE